MVGSRTGTSPVLDGMTDLTGKAVVISGGATGVGRATAKLLAAHGAKVFIFGPDEQQLHDALDDMRSTGSPNVHGIVADQSRGEDIEHVFAEADARIGGCDILINNAAVAGGSVADKGFDEIQYVVSANLVGYLACTH